MSDSGSGIGFPIATMPTAEVPYDIYEELEFIPNCAVSLSRYAKLIRYDEASFWGVLYENQPRYGCGPLWSEGDRMQIELALAIAQQQIESFINYPLCETWISGSVDTQYNHDHRWTDQQPFKSSRFLTRYPRLIQPGIRAVSMISAGEAVVHSEKVGTIGPIAVSFTDPNEVKVFYPDSNRQIKPSRIAIVDGELTIEIPRYRMVIQDLLNTPEGGILYEDMNAFLTEVDVVRIYNDPSVQAILVRPGCSNNFCTGGCGECTHSACIYMRDKYVGLVDVRPALWNADTLAWDTETVCAGHYTVVRLNYQCGVRYLSLEAENAIIQLAHSLMANEPCACDTVKMLWKEHKEMPKIMTREILNCPFGKTNGGWTAYTWAKRFRSIRAQIF